MVRFRARRLLVRIASCLLIAVALAALAGVGSASDVFEGFRLRASDTLQPRGHIDGSIVVVGIDARSLAELGVRWPWPRQLDARLIRGIASARPRAIAVDLLFAEPTDGDADLAEAVGTANVLLATGVGTRDERDGMVLAAQTTPPVPQISARARAVGHTAVIADPTDGIVRTVPLVVDTNAAFVPSLALATLAVAEGKPPDVVVRPDGVQIADRFVPTDSLHRLRMSWPRDLEMTNAGMFVSAADVLAGRVSAATFRDKVVFLGVTEPTLGDNHLTPVAKTLGQPGVIAQAAAYNTMVTRAYLTPASSTEVAVWVFCVALLIALAVQFLPLWSGVASTIVVVGGSVMIGYARGAVGVIPNFVYPVIAAVVALPASGAVRYATETRRRREVARLFAQYVPKRVADDLMADGRVEAARSGQRLEVTVLFCDLRGFTAMCAQLEPTEVNHRLSHFYEYATQIVHELDGTLMQFIGDEVFAVFGAPIADDHHATAAVECARRLQEEVGRLDDVLATNGAPPLRFGIGLNAGEVVAAHVGTRVHRQYTVIGTTVNVASRLCSRAGPGEVVLADAVYRSAEPPPTVEAMPPAPMKGVRDDFIAWRLALDHPPPVAKSPAVGSHA